MKNFTLFIFTIFAFATSNAQVEEGFRVGLDFGAAIPSNGSGGFLLSIEPKYNIKDNMNVGLRLGIAGMIRDVEKENGEVSSASLSINSSTLATFDYYFNQSGGKFVPFVGGGVGYYRIANVKFDDVQNNSSQDVQLDASGKFGALMRGGFEWGKFRMGLEYNLVPKSTLQDLNGNRVSDISNSYLGLHLGFYVGGGKWGR